MDLFSFFSDYLQSQVDEIIHNIIDIRSPGYMWLFLCIFIKIYRKFNNISKNYL